MLVLKKGKPRKTNKTKPKRQRTYTSSQFSLPQDRNHMSLSELFKNDLLKRKGQPKNMKSQKQLGLTKKRTKSKSKLKLDKCETYEVIPYKNSLNSEIVFSNEETKRQGTLDDTVSEQLAIRVNQQYLVDSNRQLRISIKKEYQKKVEAAIKIQKVFRGFLTRKILQKYVQQQQKILSEKLAQHRSESISEHSSYFADKQNNESKKRVQSDQLGIFQYSNQHQNEEQDEREQDEEEEEEEDLEEAVYRHHEPIYSHDQISGYLSSSEEEDFDQDAFNHHIIFQTNEEYIDSRKSSGQQMQPRNKLSRAGQPDPIREERPETPTNSQPNQDLDLSRTEKKADRDRMMKGKVSSEEIKEETMKLTDETQKSTVPLPAFLQKVDYGTTLKENDGMMKKSPQRFAEADATNLQILKQAEKMRWQQIIQLVQSQINKTAINNMDMNEFMKQIMDMSIKNKELLELQEPTLHNNLSQSQLYLQKSLAKIDSRSKLKNIKANRHYLSNNYQAEMQHQMELENTLKIYEFQEVRIEKEQKVKPNQNSKFQKLRDNFVLPQKANFFEKNGHDQIHKAEDKSDVPASFHSPISSFENTGQMKKFLSGNIQDEHIEQMLRLRQQLMKKREVQEMKRLNVDLQNRIISQQQFLTRLQDITIKYNNEKTCIQKTKQDIARGYQAALKLTKEAFNDAKKLGYNLPISRSQQGLRFKSPLVFSDVIIDQMVHFKKQEKNHRVEQLNQPQTDSVKINLQSDHQSSDLQFTEEELKRFRRAQPYDIELAEEIADLGRNVMITQQLLRQQQLEDQQNVLMKTQHVCRQIYQIQEASPAPKNDPKVQLMTQKMLQWVLYQVSCEFLVKPLFSQKLIDKNHFYKPHSVTDKQRLRFIELLEKNFPQISQINSKLNQKICPLPTQLLRCMRIDFSEEDDDQNSYQQIGKYEFIIGQEICNEAIKIFRKQFEQYTPNVQPLTQDIQHLLLQFPLGQKVAKYIDQREKYISNRKNHTKQLRWQVLNIELHCIFDAWNEELIFLRSQKAGYSGIGLNQLTLSVKDHNCLVPLVQTLQIIKEGRKRLINNLSMSSPGLIFPLIIDEDDEEQLQTDSRWIFYADEALSYGLELVYLIEQQIFSEMGKELRKKMLQFF